MLKSSPQKSPIFAVSLQEKSSNNLCALKRKHRRIRCAGKSDENGWEADDNRCKADEARTSIPNIPSLL